HRDAADAGGWENGEHRLADGELLPRDPGVRAARPAARRDPYARDARPRHVDCGAVRYGRSAARGRPDAGDARRGVGLAVRPLPAADHLQDGATVYAGFDAG